MVKKSSQEAYTTIRSEIIGGVIRSDEVVLEQAVAERFKLSRNSAHDVLQRLCTEKYLKSFPRKGYLVTNISATQHRQLQQVRYQVEAFAIRTIIQKCSDEEIKPLYDILEGKFDNHDPYETITMRFHLEIAKLTENEYVRDFLHTYVGYSSRYALTAIHTIGYQEYEDCHQEIVKAMLRRDVDAALDALRRDLSLRETDL